MHRMELNAERLTVPGLASLRTPADPSVSLPARGWLPAAAPLDDASLPQGPPFLLRWGEASRPLPLRSIRPAGRLRTRFPQEEPPPWLPTGPTHEPFDFCGHVRRL